MNGYRSALCLTAACALVAALPVQATSLDQALTGGTFNLDMRLRYETVDDSVNKDAQAGTLRTRLGYRTGDYRHFSAFGELLDVHSLAGLDNYAPERNGRATVADPEVSEVNQVLLAYDGLPDSRGQLGRQRIILDNARFVGNVGWRQNEQTFEAFYLTNRSLPHTTLRYAYLYQVKGIMKKFDADINDHLINIHYDGLPAVAITAYAYLLENKDSNADNDNYGLRLNGESETGGGTTLLYTAEFTRQSANDSDADYLFLEGGARFHGVTAKVGYEMLGSDNGNYGFQTPLATKHAFNGWADMFLVTPDDGLRDLMASVGGTVVGIGLRAVYHDFSADKGGDDYGTELDLLAARKFGDHYRLGLKYANYNADNWKEDTRKLWAWGEFSL